MTWRSWRATLVSILWTRITLQNWRAKLISLLLAITVWYLIAKNIATTFSPPESSSAAAVSQTR
jgi:YbbR domain-containing protein